MTLPSGDGQPGGDAVLGFAIDWPACNDGIDNDGDGYVDEPEDPGCRDALADREASQCQDGLNNDPDQDAQIDFDGGLSILGYVAAEPDANCVGQPWRNRETTPKSCGLGVELTLLLPILMGRRARRARRMAC